MLPCSVGILNPLLCVSVRSSLLRDQQKPGMARQGIHGVTLSKTEEQKSLLESDVLPSLHHRESGLLLVACTPQRASFLMLAFVPRSLYYCKRQCSLIRD